MIERKYARAIVASFSGSVNYPKTEEAKTILVNAFQQHSDNLEHAKLIAEELRIENHFSPQVDAIRRVSIATTTRERAPGCDHCEGGFIHEDRKVLIRGLSTTVPVSLRCPRCKARMEAR